MRNDGVRENPIQHRALGFHSTNPPRPTDCKSPRLSATATDCAVKIVVFNEAPIS